MLTDPSQPVAMSEKGWKYIGYNFDLTIKVQDMRQDNPNESHHFFYTIAVQDQIDTSHLDSSKPQQLVSNLTVSDFLLSRRENIIIIVARVIVHKFEEFKFLASGVPSHILHKYSEHGISPLLCAIKDNNERWGGKGRTAGVLLIWG